MKRTPTPYSTAPFCIGILSVLLWMLSSCSNARYLSEKQSLYLGAKVKIEDTLATSKERKALEEELSDAVKPAPNSSFLTIRLKLTLYNLAGVPKKEKGIRNWLRNKIGEPPVLGSSVNIGYNRQVLENVLHNYGYFRAQADGELKLVKKKKSEAHFVVRTGPRTYIRNVSFEPGDTIPLKKDIIEDFDKTYLKSGNPYNFADIRNERLRIDYALKNKGYYYFNPEFLLVDADTAAGPQLIDLTVKLKHNEMAPMAYGKYIINKVTILPNYRISNTNQTRRATRLDSAAARSGRNDTTYVENFTIVDRRENYKPRLFVQAIQLRPGTYYSKTKQNITLNRLVTLGAFKFVKNEFSVDTAANKLNVTYLLTPYAKKSFNGEFGGFTQNDSRGGVRASITWKNKNLFKGAEVFSIKGFGSFEAQFGGENNTKRPNAYNFGIETNLSFPRFIVPFFKVKPSGMYIPRTIVSASYNYSLRQDFYRVNSVNLGAGYNWKEEIRKDHKLFPLNITAVKTDTINAANSSQFNFSNLIFNGIILGPTYEYTFNSQLDGVTRTNNYYFNGLLDLSGNILGLVQGAKQNDKKQLLGTNYAQYIKIQTDFRYYRKTNSKSTVALRAFAGFGYSYGNSYTLPNVKLFFSGGSSSLRGFAARLVGPGTFHQDASQIKTFEILGDIKGELNAEYRWKFYKFLELGAFVDAGNIWLLRDNPTFPGGTFSNQFYKEIAMDMGLGLRLDLSILLVRFDFAIPIRKPWYPEGERWRFNDIRFASPEWRNENLYFNLAIGYPF